MPLRRSRRLTLPGGACLRTPLLIPSLSTRNVGRIDVEDRPESVASVALQALAGQITESLLVSAFDLHHGLLADSERLLAGEAATLIHGPELVMVDSGLYEVQQRAGYDDGAGIIRPWSQGTMLDVYRSLPSNLPAALVSYDADSLPYAEQIAQARLLFSEVPGRATVMLLKPEQAKGFIDPAQLAAVAGGLNVFSIVAVTEKELGNTLGERLRTLARLRRMLDQEKVAAPLHVFGGLDPLLTPLYVACGAEIVDGVGWLRYAYFEDVAHYQESRAVLELDLDLRVTQRLFRTVADNLAYLRDLKRRLLLFVDDGDWERFSEKRGKQLGAIWRSVAHEAEVT